MYVCIHIHTHTHTHTHTSIHADVNSEKGIPCERCSMDKVKEMETTVWGATKSSVLLECHKEGEPSEGSRRSPGVEKQVWLEFGVRVWYGDWIGISGQGA